MEEEEEGVITSLKMLILSEERKISDLNMPLRTKNKKIKAIQTQVHLLRLKNLRRMKERSLKKKDSSLLVENILNLKQGNRKLGMTMSMEEGIQENKNNRIDPSHRKNTNISYKSSKLNFTLYIVMFVDFCLGIRTHFISSLTPISSLTKYFPFFSFT